ncbi:hypothetical protein SDC9_185577 [bioreactor metagenome]|uniref:Uncharacterized protein n=1 Tax=bioreactor metagenome TaxID=1076179 RepID=A0A645HPK5_9ZZZZ
MIDFLFRADVHASCRFVKNIDFSVRNEPLAERDLLLVSTREVADFLVGALAFNSQFINVFLCDHPVVFRAYKMLF